MKTGIVDRRHAGLAPIALAFVLASLLGAPRAAFADAVVRQLSGRVEVGRGEPPVWTPLATGQVVLPNERVRTGPDGRVELALEDSTLRVHENSLLALPPATADAVQVELESGRSLFDVLRREGRRFEVRTPTVVVSVKGTRFGVEAGEQAGVVSVYRGTVGVRATQASEVVETLVREGFLATGGGDQPFELDVVPTGDPWSTWQQFQTGSPSSSATEAPTTELERARASLRHATDGEVLKRAAERRPEIAERLRQHVAETKAAPTEASEADGEKKTPRESGPAPAAPAALDDLEGGGDGRGDPSEKPGGRIESADDGGLGGRDPAGDGHDAVRIDDAIRSVDSIDPVLPAKEVDATAVAPEVREIQRDLLDVRRVDGSLKAVDSVVDVPTLTGGAPLGNGETTLSTDHLASYDPREVMLLMNALQELQAASDSLARPWTESDMATYLEAQLVGDGLPPAEARALVEGLFK